MDSLKTGKLICESRKRHGLSQKELAERVFVSDKAVSKWERGLSFPDISKLIPLSEVLEISLYDILTGGEVNGQD
ncbi:MAG: helix-turn-helix domain-containing protein [Sphaerochaetaceae bacterium]|nr:helix-turn-helix domain-containing protein [Sphaerochaetaceae bacterium]